jgi:hypothetical protein
MIQHALHQTAYLDVAKHYHKRWETPSIKEDENGEGKTVIFSRHPPITLRFTHAYKDVGTYHLLCCPCAA